jgi:hypothetical protein
VAASIGDGRAPYFFLGGVRPSKAPPILLISSVVNLLGRDNASPARCSISLLVKGLTTLGFSGFLAGIKRSSKIPYNNRMTEDIVVDGDKFDEALRRLLNAKPITKAEISARIKAERQAKREAKKKG